VGWRASLEPDLAAERLQHPGDQVDERALSSSVRADDGVAFAAQQGEVQTPKNGQATKGHLQPPDLKDLQGGGLDGRYLRDIGSIHVRALRSFHDAHVIASVGSTPLRKADTITTRSSPIQKYQ